LPISLTTNKQELQDALGLAIRAVSPRTAIPILECFLLTAKQDDGLVISGSSTEMNINTAPINASINLPGTIALDAKLFSDIIRKMPGELVSLEADTNNNVLVKSGRTKLNVAAKPGDEYPTMHESNENDSTNTYIIKEHILKDMIRQTIFSVSTDQSKLILTGGLIEVKDGNMRMVTVDMYRISYKAVPLEGHAPDAKVVVPGKALSELARMLSSDENEDVKISITDKRVIFTTSSFTLVSNLLEGEFIRYDQIFNEDFTTMVETNRANLLEAFERASLIAVDTKMPPTKMEITDNDLIISAQNDRGDRMEDGIPCTTDGKELTISFNPRYFIDALRVVEDEKIILKFNTQLSPATIRGTDESYKYLIVPLRP